MTENKPGKKMKITGYGCIVFALLLTVMIVFSITPDDRVQVTLSLISTWLLTGVGLLTANAAKRIAGNTLINKQNGLTK